VLPKQQPRQPPRTRRIIEIPRQQPVPSHRQQHSSAAIKTDIRTRTLVIQLSDRDGIPIPSGRLFNDHQTGHSNAVDDRQRCSSRIR
jgi:hypothetical protein